MPLIENALSTFGLGHAVAQQYFMAQAIMLALTVVLSMACLVTVIMFCRAARRTKQDYAALRDDINCIRNELGELANAHQATRANSPRLALVALEENLNGPVTQPEPVTPSARTPDNGSEERAMSRVSAGI